jgi:hypothetical protein
MNKTMQTMIDMCKENGSFKQVMQLPIYISEREVSANKTDEQLKELIKQRLKMIQFNFVKDIDNIINS